MTGKLRCAIYTRKSSEEGLDQDFNSLHAQRESCEAYIKSQVGEGWVAHAKAYDDGGFSGGSMDRPGLKALLEDIAFGKVDVVVVYKVDRLTRSLADFAKIVEQFDSRGVSFVSVTQAFNTTSSMGRLTLNVLLSFAQFEREVTGERIRDKIAASKAKGMWMGGVPPLGYGFADRKLVINPAEAATVRHIYERYLALPSAYELMEELDRDGIRSKRWTTNAGREMGGAKLWRGALYHILSARVYIGEIVHRDKSYPGLHEPIVSREVFNAVAAKLAAAKVRRARRAKPSTGALTGILFDHAGDPLSPTFGYGKQGKAYRYYVAAKLQTGKVRQMPDGAISRVSASAVERLIAEELTRLIGAAAIAPTDLQTYLTRVELRPSESHLFIHPAAFAPDEPLELVLTAVRRRLRDGEQAIVDRGTIRVVLPRRFRLRGGAKSLYGASDAGRGVIDPIMVLALRKAHADLSELKIAPMTASADFCQGQAPHNQHGRLYAKLAYLAPHLQRQILQGRQPRGLTIRSLTRGALPLAWADQQGWLERQAYGAN